MKFYIDENLTPKMSGPLTQIYRHHQFRTPGQEHLGGVKDTPLFGDLAARDFDAIITEDKEQLEDIGERDALRGAHLHWIGVKQLDGRGTLQVASQLAVVLAGLYWVLEDWGDQPTIYKLVAPRSTASWQPSIELV